MPNTPDPNLTTVSLSVPLTALRKGAHMSDTRPEAAVFANDHLVLNLDCEAPEILVPVVGGDLLLQFKRLGPEESPMSGQLLQRYLLIQAVLPSAVCPGQGQPTSLRGVLWSRQAALSVNQQIASYQQGVSQIS